MSNLNTIDTDLSQAISRIDRIYQMSDDMHSYITQDLSSTKYFDADRISSLKITFTDLFIIHINIRSLNKNIDDLLEFLTEIGTHPNIICLTETQLKQSSLVNNKIPGYKFCHVDSDTNAGGVGIYIDEEMEFACENLYSFSKNGLEKCQLYCSWRFQHKYSATRHRTCGFLY